MLYPIKGDCATQPLIKIADVTLRNIKQYGTYLTPGIVRCNETAPCTGIVFENVQSNGWWSKLGWGYITENVEGSTTDSYPVPSFNSGGSFTKGDFTTSVIPKDFKS